jgi:hypothetical protein
VAEALLRLLTPLRIVLPYHCYAVPCTMGRSRTILHANLAGNAMAGLAYGPAFKTRVVGAAKRQMYADARYSTLAETPQEARSAREIVSVVLSVTVRSPLASTRKDRDNTIAGLKAAADGIAAALGVDDRVFSWGSVEFEKGEPRTTILVEVGR